MTNVIPTLVERSRLVQVLGFPLTDADYTDCISQIEIIEPQLGQFWQLDAAFQGIYFLITGKVRLIDKQGELITTLLAGSSFGEASLFPSEFEFYAARASLNVKLGYLNYQQLLSWKERYPQMWEHLQKRAQTFNSLMVSSTSEEQISDLPQLSLSLPARQPNQIGKAYFPHPSQRVSHFLQQKLRRYPFFAQQTDSDCGAACLVMIARYWGKNLSVNRLRDLANIDNHGASLKGLAIAAESVGFTTRPVIANLRQLAQQKLPAIAHWQGKHYVVVYHISRKEVIIADPALGQKKLTHAAFQTHWTGYTLLLEPTVIWRKTESAKPIFGEFFQLIKPYKVVLLEIFLASIFIQIFGLIIPLLTQVIFDQVLLPEAGLTLATIGWGLLIFSLFRVAMTGLRQYLLDRTANQVDTSLIVGLVRHIFLLPLNFFESRHVGDVIARIQENRKIQQFLTGETLGIILDLFTVFIYFFVLFSYNSQLAWLVLVSLIPFGLLALVATPFLQQISRESFQAIATESSYLIESLNGIRTIKSMAVEQSVRWHWEALFQQQIKTNFASQLLANRLQIISNTIEALATTGLLWLGASLVIENKITLGQLVALQMLLVNIIRPFQRLTAKWYEFQEVSLATERISDVINYAPETNLATNAHQILPSWRGHIRFENVTFRYHHEGEFNVIENLSFEIKPGQKVALVGRSGSGKTTISKLILGLYFPTRGKILIDGQDISTLYLPSLRQQIGVVDQDTFLFSGTVRENISLGRPHLSLTEVINAAQVAGADGFIKELPLGYETQIGEGGGMLSGGQRQRIAIARALLNRPHFLILDEATSHLDAESERIIQNNLNSFFQNRTTLVIAHRLSTIHQADLILVLDRGVLVESGTHLELMAKKGHYFYLNQQQLNVAQ
ncbi:peptidase domain-containing ABC transporter [Merismopedia glauca]|uniref:Peptidase C39 n=1 Tax=Merismopedia glauca CCAP 1448/3 TaxID=1296344 RepID=A0A2T1BZ62_9CYAN|nr:peptidase domain-containing ABC transporter [Merismopedia glauca]PSB01198.1 peptidase C39 [Merismopedia glauca CCAP 1448/3]